MAGWRVSFYGRCVTLYPKRDSNVRIVFSFEPTKPARLAELRYRPASRYTWMWDPGSSLLEVVPDFIVPFEDEARSGAPLFTAAAPDTVECRADILTSSLWTLARLEETLSVPTDEHGRFPASASAAFHLNYLDRPIVDEYALALRQAISHVLPAWSPEPLQLRLKLSHDIDIVGFPRQLRSTAGHIYPRWMPQAFLRDVFSMLGVGLPAYLQAVLETARISRDGGFDSAFYWKACARTQWDSGYDPEHPRVRAVIDRLRDEGFEMGVHAAYGAFESDEQLEAEVGRLRRVLGPGPLGGRHHFLRWQPSTWRVWEKAGLAYDSSVGFSDLMGFRAGTAIPYHPWLIEEDRESALLEIPLVVMDCTPVNYMQLRAANIVARIAQLIRCCQATGGVFTLLWHNSSVIERPYASLYPDILSLFPSRARYDWKADLAIPPLPRDIGETTGAYTSN
jgi:hypothetical protein